MFCRTWSGLPPAHSFPNDLEALGYFVNEDDEVRSIKDDKFYFHYFLTKNARVNDCQRFAFHTAIRQIILQRLETEGVRTLLLPPGVRASDPHVPVLVSDNLSTSERVLLFVGEPLRGLGVLAPRVSNGLGGISAGSILPLVRRVRGADAAFGSTAIVIANPGELWWWPKGRRPVSPTSVKGVPLPSAVHSGHWFDAAVNSIPGHENVLHHIERVFIDVIAARALPQARIDIIAVTDGAHGIEEFLDQDTAWATWGRRLNAFAIVGGCLRVTRLQNPGFKQFLMEGHVGNHVLPLGCPVFSGGEYSIDEMIMTKAMPAIVNWLDHVAATDDYHNPDVLMFGPDDSLGAESGVNAADDTWGTGQWTAFDDLPEEQRPSVYLGDNPSGLLKEAADLLHLQNLIWGDTSRPADDDDDDA